MMTIDEIRELNDDELKKLSMKKNKYGNATYEAEMAYAERRRRSGVVQYTGISNRCNKYQADIDYYGSANYV